MMPVIQDAFTGWTQSITLIKITQAVDNNGVLVNTQTPINFEGTIQPLMPQKMVVSAQGERFWSWLQIHTPYQLGKVVNDNDLISYSGKNYKVMLLNDYSINGYYEYHLVEDYQG